MENGKFTALSGSSGASCEALTVDACAALGIDVSPEQTARFSAYKNLLLAWNEKINLTAITDDAGIALKHFADSASVLLALDMKPGERLVDVGTGAGFPGIPLAILRPGIECVLLDSLNKRVSFLNEVVAALGLDGVSAVHSRAEDAARLPLYRERFDYSVSRAVSALPVLAEFCVPFVKIGGAFAALKGNDIKEELTAALPAIKRLGGEISDIKHINIPFSDITHSIVIIRKARHTPSEFPRTPAKILKSPILR